MESKVLEYRADVLFGGALRDRELLGDPAVGQSSADEERHLLLAGGEFLRSWVERLLLLGYGH
jgi:hypothetical protein